jgi:hypothetical protein
MNEQQLMVGIDDPSGNIVIALGPMRIAMTPKDATSFIACIGTVLAQHPQLQPKPASQILIAGALPTLAGGINLDGR